MNWKVLAASLFGVFAPIYPIMLVTGFLIVADLITGVMAARKRGEKITSAVFGRTISKIAVYNIVVMSGFLAEVYMIGGALPISKVAASIIGLTELLSILENAESIYGQPMFKRIKELLGSSNDRKKE